MQEHSKNHCVGCVWLHSRGPKRGALKSYLTNLLPETRWMHPRSVLRKVKKYDRDGFVDRKRFGRTHVTFGDLTEYAKELASTESSAVPTVGNHLAAHRLRLANQQALKNDA